MPQPAPPISYTTLTALFTSHLTIAIHTILASRSIYPSTTFLRARAYNLPVMQSRHPGVCQWINDAVTAVEAELLKGTVARVALVIWEAWWEGDAVGTGSESSAGRNLIEGARPLERYVWDVSRWPTIPQEELHTPLMRAAASAEGVDAAAEDLQSAQGLSDEERRAQFQATLKKAYSDLYEQFRALLSRLSTVSSGLAPLPCGADRCTYTVVVELKEEADPPIGHPQAWIPSERGTQRSIVHGVDYQDDDSSGENGDGQSVRREKVGGRMMQVGRDLGGVKTTPVRSVDQGEMIFEMWVEEGRAKFHNR